MVRMKEEILPKIYEINQQGGSRKPARPLLRWEESLKRSKKCTGGRKVGRNAQQQGAMAHITKVVVQRSDETTASYYRRETRGRTSGVTRLQHHPTEGKREEEQAE